MVELESPEPMRSPTSRTKEPDSGGASVDSLSLRALNKPLGYREMGTAAGSEAAMVRVCESSSLHGSRTVVASFR